MHIDYYLVANGLSGECSLHRFGSTTAQPLHLSSSFFFQCLVSFLSQQSDAKWSRHCLQNGAQVSHWCLSFSPAYRFGDGHASIPDRSFILSCWQPLMISVIKKGQCQQSQFFLAILFLGLVRIFLRPLDNNVVATFVSQYMITEYVLASKLVQVAIWLS